MGACSAHGNGREGTRPTFQRTGTPATSSNPAMVSERRAVSASRPLRAAELLARTPGTRCAPPEANRGLAWSKLFFPSPTKRRLCCRADPLTIRDLCVQRRCLLAVKPKSAVTAWSGRAVRAQLGPTFSLEDQLRTQG